MKKQLYWEDVTEGQEIPSLSKAVSTMTLVKWAGAYGDFNPLHFENSFAVDFMKTPGIIVHGTLKRQMLIQMLTDWIGDGGWLNRIETQFRAMDYPRPMKSLTGPGDGDTLTCKGKVTGKSVKDDKHRVELDIWLENSKGETTTLGTATVTLPVKN
jgi:acyl dehydratase